MIQNAFTEITNHALGSNILLKIGLGKKIYKEKDILPDSLKELVVFNREI
jgi:hypothetical protein